jgi:predicted transcriptional regulator
MSKDRYKAAIKESGYMKKYIAKEIGSNQAQFSRWLNNKQGSGISEDQIKKLNEFLGF